MNPNPALWEEERGKERMREELPEAPWAGAWRRPRRRSRHWRTVQRSGEAEGAAWEEGRSEGSPECSYGTARQPGMRGTHRKEMQTRVRGDASVIKQKGTV